MKIFRLLFVTFLWFVPSPTINFGNKSFVKHTSYALFTGFDLQQFCIETLLPKSIIGYISEIFLVLPYTYFLPLYLVFNGISEIMCGGMRETYSRKTKSCLME